MKRPCVAYYAAEYAINDELPIYAGGLGVLAADIVMQAGEQGWPMMAFGMAYQHTVAGKNSKDEPRGSRRLVKAGFTRVKGRDGKPFETLLDFGDWACRAGAWEKRLGKARLVLIDTNLKGNTDFGQRITSNLYDTDLVTRLLQQFVMAQTSVLLMDELGIEPVRYHINEGHMAFVTLVLAARYRQAYGAMPLSQALAAVRPRIVGTKHTILPGAGDFAEEATLARVFGNYLRRYGWNVADLMEAGAKDTDALCELDFGDSSGARLDDGGVGAAVCKIQAAGIGV
jgi:starch phosphorylase